MKFLDIATAIQLFSPYIIIHSQEKNFPISVPDYIDACELRYDDVEQTVIVPHGQLNSNSLITQFYNGESSGNINRMGNPKKTKFYLNVVDKNIQKGNREVSEVPIYSFYNVIKIGNDTYYDILYYATFGFNGSILRFPLNKITDSGVHPFDIEAVIVRVKAHYDGSPYNAINRIMLTQHSGGLWIKKDNIEFMDNTHPVCYAAKASHALYPTGKVWHRLFSLANDKTDSTGILWQPKVEQIQIKNDDINVQNMWAHFSGVVYKGSQQLPHYRTNWRETINFGISQTNEWQLTFKEFPFLRNNKNTIGWTLTLLFILIIASIIIFSIDTGISIILTIFSTVVLLFGRALINAWEPSRVPNYEKSKESKKNSKFTKLKRRLSRTEPISEV